MKSSKALVIAMVAVLCGACATNECLENRSAIPMANFWTSEPSPKRVALDSIMLYGNGAPGDSVLISLGRNVEEIDLPFRINSNETTFTIKYLQKQLAQYDMSDRITFYYDAEPWFYSEACGAGYRYVIKDIKWTDEFIDSVKCEGNIINNSGIANIRIYFRTSTDF